LFNSIEQPNDGSLFTLDRKRSQDFFGNSRAHVRFFSHDHAIALALHRTNACAMHAFVRAQHIVIAMHRASFIPHRSFPLFTPS
jgi:hypothetical protein